VQALHHPPLHLDRALVAAFSGRSKAAMMVRAQATSLSAGEKAALQGAIWLGWISVLPSKPMSRASAHSRAKPASSPISFQTPSRMARPLARAAASDSISQAFIGARPGTMRAPVSLARSLVPMTKPESRVVRSAAAAAMAPAFSMASGVSIIAQTAVRSGAPAFAMAAAGGDRGPRPAHLGQEDDVGAGRRERLQVLGAPGRVEAVEPHHHLARAEAALAHRLRHLAAGDLLGVGRHRVLEVEDHDVGGQRAGLFQRAGVGAGHVEDGAAGTDAVRHGISPVVVVAVQHSPAPTNRQS
jgi:hypothetical protein